MTRPWTDADVQAAIWLGIAIGGLGLLAFQGLLALAFRLIDRLAARTRRALEVASVRNLDQPHADTCSICEANVRALRRPPAGQGKGR